jgi:hypothetical protein
MLCWYTIYIPVGKSKIKTGSINYKKKNLGLGPIDISHMVGKFAVFIFLTWAGKLGLALFQLQIEPYTIPALTTPVQLQAEGKTSLF